MLSSVLLALTCVAGAFALPAGVPARRWDKPAVKPKVMIVSMFHPEDVWTERLGLTKNITVPGTSQLFPDVRCNEAGEICQFITGEGEINAAVTVTSVAFSDALDLTETYFFVAGIAGVNPYMGTLGSVAFARFAVQVALARELDARQMPSNWSTGYWLQGTPEPGVAEGRHVYGTEVFELNAPLRDRIKTYAAGVKLNDSAQAQKYRAQYDFAPANEPPAIFDGDVATSDVYYSGNLLCEAFGNITNIWTRGEGKYSMTAQEDNASFEAMIRAHAAHKLDFSRTILIRTGSDFDRQPPNLDAYTAFISEQGGFTAAIENIWLVGKPVIDGIIADWDSTFAKGIEPQADWVKKADALGTLTGNPSAPDNLSG